MLNICQTYDKDIYEKFILDADGNYYNERLEIEINKRKSYCESRRSNRLTPTEPKKKKQKKICKTYVKHMENEIVNEIVIEKEYENLFIRWLNYKKSRNETYRNKDSVQTCYNKLFKFSNGNIQIAEKIIDDAIGNNYAGFFEPKPINNTKPEERKFTRVKCIYDGNEQIMTKLEYERGLEKCPELMKFIAYV